MLATVFIVIECFLCGFIVGRARYKYFPDSFMKQKFLDEHKKSGLKARLEWSIGLPDMGSGRYADKLDYPSWVNFNNAMRVH